MIARLRALRPHFVLGVLSQLVGLGVLVLDFRLEGLALALALHFLVSGLGVTVGFHRLLAHRAFTVPKPLEYLLAVCGSLAMHGDPIQWVTIHRQHHRFSDTDQDPHNARRGFWYAHSWWFHEDFFRFVTPDRELQYAPDLLAQPFYRLLRRFLGVVALAVVGALWWWGGWFGLGWGVFVRYLLGNQATFLVNSAGHTFGWVAYRRSDLSTNCWWVAVPSFGEGWHNNHHAFPASARLGLRPLQLDMGWWVILALEACGLARDVKRPTDAEVAAGSGPRSLGELLGVARPER